MKIFELNSRKIHKSDVFSDTEKFLAENPHQELYPVDVCFMVDSSQLSKKIRWIML